MKNRTLPNTELGVKDHPGVPLIFAWGLHIGLSYQRPHFSQETLEYMVRNGIDEPAKWGATLVDLFPSNKEAHFTDDEFQEHAEPPKYLFREYPDDDQEFQWNIDHFLAFNQRAHEKDFLVTWMIHQWYRYPHMKRAEFMWKFLQELGLQICDPLRQGWKECIDGFMVEGSFFVPEAVCEYLWPFHPGIYYRESMWNYNYTVPNFINPGYHLTDGRTLICDSDYSIKPSESLIGNPEVWQGKDHRVKYGRQWVTAQIEARDMKCSEQGWENYGGMATVDLIIEQINNYARAKGINWEGACTTAMRFINEVLISKGMRRYVFGISQDPVRCAIAGEITSTARDGRFSRIEQPQGTYFLQNNHFRLYCCPDDARVELQWDPSGLADHTQFLSKNIQKISDNLLQTQALQNQAHWGSICHSIEEAGALATLRQRVEWRSPDDNALSEFRWFTTESDSPWIRVKINRLFSTGEYESTTILNLQGYSLSERKSREQLPLGGIVRFSCPGRPDISVLLPQNGIQSAVWKDGKLVFYSAKSRSVLFEFLILISTAEIEPQEAQWLSVSPEVTLVTGEAAVENPTSLTCVRAVRVVDPPEGVYWVQENGWWMCRPAQPSREKMDTDYCKVFLPAGKTSRIRSYGLFDGVSKPGWGCQYMMILKDIVSLNAGGSVIVKVVDISPKIFAPRVEFAHTIASAELDGRPWHYFDERFVFLPQKRGTYKITVTYGSPKTPHLIATFSKVTETKWSNGDFEFACDWNEWSEGAPETFKYHAAIKLEGRKLLGVRNAETVRTTPLFRSIESYELSGEDSIVHMVPRDYNDTLFKPLSPYGGVVVRFLPDAIKLLIQD